VDRGYDTENQLSELREYCRRQQWEIVTEYIDRESGNPANNRDAFRQLFDDAANRGFDVVLVWALDRFNWDGMYETFEHVRTLNSYGVHFESFTEPQFRSTGPTGEIMVVLAAWLAKQNRLRISERTKAGLVRAAAPGRKGGRPVRIFRRDHALALREQGWSWRAVAREMGVPLTAVRRALGAEKPRRRGVPQMSS